MRFKVLNICILFLSCPLIAEALTVEEIVNSSNLCNCRGLEVAKSDLEMTQLASQIQISWTSLFENVKDSNVKKTIEELHMYQHQEGSYSSDLKNLAQSLNIPPEFLPYFVGLSGNLGGEASFEKQKFMIACIYAKLKAELGPVPIPPTPLNIDSLMISQSATITQLQQKMKMIYYVLIGGFVSLVVLLLSLFFRRSKKNSSLNSPDFDEFRKLLHQFEKLLANSEKYNTLITKTPEKKETFDLPIKIKTETLPPASIPREVIPAVDLTNSQIIYSNHPEGNYFTRLSESFEPQKSVYQIIVNKNKPNSGIFIIVENTEARNYHYTFTDALRKACNLRGTGTPPIHAKVKEGKVMRDGEMWKIIEKITITW